ncbi:MAG: DUF177 domain-containing protein [Myxococcales bacterium]|nr:DUF177 domain-containing protein [Myxococcales bacterium]
MTTSGTGDSAAPLTINLEKLIELGPGPHPLAAVVAVEWLAQLLSETDATVEKPGRFTGDLTFLGSNSVLIRGQLEAEFTVPCARCLEPAIVSANAELCARYEREAPAEEASEDEEDAEIDPDEPDLFPYAGHELDLRPMLAEYVVMAYPIRALCARGEACRGLCSRCGADLNAQASDGPCEACAQRAEADDGDSEEPSWKQALRKITTPD